MILAQVSNEIRNRDLDERNSRDTAQFSTCNLDADTSTQEPNEKKTSHRNNTTVIPE